MDIYSFCDFLFEMLEDKLRGLLNNKCFIRYLWEVYLGLRGKGYMLDFFLRLLCGFIVCLNVCFRVGCVFLC